MTVPYWADGSEEASAWDFCWLGDDLLPGVVTDFKCPNRRRLDQQASPGKDGVTLKDTGYELTAGSITFRMWTREQQEAWVGVRRRIDPKLRGTRTPLPILHPQTVEAGISTVWIEEVDAGQPNSLDGRYVTIRWQEWTTSTRLAKVSKTTKSQRPAVEKGSEKPKIEVNVFS